MNINACMWSIVKGLSCGFVEILLRRCTASISSLIHFRVNPASDSLCITYVHMRKFFTKKTDRKGNVVMTSPNFLVKMLSLGNVNEMPK